jgi:hypothetical protein
MVRVSTGDVLPELEENGQLLLEADSRREHLLLETVYCAAMLAKYGSRVNRFLRRLLFE